MPRGVDAGDQKRIGRAQFVQQTCQLAAHIAIPDQGQSQGFTHSSNWLWTRSNSALSRPLGAGRSSTTCLAQSKYWRLRSKGQSGGAEIIERKFEILSA